MKIGLGLGITLPRGAGGVSIVSGPTWTDNADGTATVTFTTDVACYAGVDYGSSSGAYTASAFDYNGAGPDLALGTSHTVEVPDALAGGTEADGTWYYRLWLQPASGSASYSSEYSGTISTGPGGAVNVVTLENGTDVLLLETGDYLLVEGAADAKITAFGAAATLADTDILVGVQAASPTETTKITLSALKAYING